MSKRKTTKQFIQEAQHKYANKFDYSKSIYKKAHENILITCNIHNHKFLQTPNNHLKGNGGCELCKAELMQPNRADLKNAFIKKSQEVHLDNYDYSEVNYINAHTKVKIICEQHGHFYQLPLNHTRGHGCEACGGSMKLTLSEFIRRANKIHKDKYDYSESKYINFATKLKIKCPIKGHGYFETTPGRHINKDSPVGCNKCSGHIYKYTPDEFIKKCKLKFKNINFSESRFIAVDKPFNYECNKHGRMESRLAYKFLNSKKGCKKCNLENAWREKTKNIDTFIREANVIHGNKYSYEKVVYKNRHEPIEILCSIHGAFFQTPGHHLGTKNHNATGCPKCNNKSEGRIAEYLIKKSIVYREYSIKNKRYDFYLPKHNLLIERDGEQHYYDVNFGTSKNKTGLKFQIKNDKYKTKLAKDSGFKISRIPYWLTNSEEEIEIENILAGKPTYPDVPDLEQQIYKPKPLKNF
jgi:very-short-patch-repair endonuclease